MSKNLTATPDIYVSWYFSIRGILASQTFSCLQRVCEDQIFFLSQICYAFSTTINVEQKYCVTSYLSGSVVWYHTMGSTVCQREEC